MESQRRSQAQKYNNELTVVNEKLLVQQDSVVSLNRELSSQLSTAEALRTEAETARGRLAEQFSVTDALRREEVVLNDQLSEQVNRAESLLVEVSHANTSLSVERDQSDSLRQVAVSTLDQARSARRETITIALANKAVRLLKLGDPALAALLARQAYAFSDPDEGEFLDPIYDALRQSLNAVGNTAGGPEVVTRHRGGVRDIVYSPDGTYLATAGEDGQIRIARLNGSGHVTDVQQLAAHAGAVRAITFSSRSESLLSAGEDGLVTEWKLPITVKPVSSKVAWHEGGAWAIAASGNGQWVASAGQLGEVIVAERSGTEFREVARVRLDTRVRSLAFIDETHAVAIGGEDGSLTIWRFRNGPSDVRKIDTGHKRVLAIAVHPDGSMLATAGDDRLARVWPINPDGNLGSPVLLEGHEGAVNDVAFSPDGERLLTASADRSVRIWRRYTRGASTPIILQQHESWVWAAAFSPDGSRLATASEDRTAQIWRTRMSTMAEDICGAVGDRALSRDEWAQHVGVDVDYDTEYASCQSAPTAPGVAAMEFLRDVNP